MFLWYIFAAITVFNYPGLVFHIILTTIVLNCFPELDKTNSFLILSGNVLVICVYHTMSLPFFILSNIFYFFLMVYLVGVNLEAQRPKFTINSQFIQ